MKNIQRGELIALAQPQADGHTLTIQILRAGDFTDMHGAPFTLSSQDLDAYIANSNALLASEQVPVEIGHPDNEDGGAPAAAWYRKFYKQVINGVEWICAEIELTALGADALAKQLYKYFSAVVWIDAQIICGGGFVNRPAVGGQQPIGTLAATITPRKGVSMSVATLPAPKGGAWKRVQTLFSQLRNVLQFEMSQEEIQRKVWDALRETYGDPLDEYGGSTPWLEATYADYVVVSKDGEFFRVDYTIGADGEVTLGNPVRVEKVYQPIGETDAAQTQGTTETPTENVALVAPPSGAGRAQSGGMLTDQELRARVEAARQEERTAVRAQQAEFETKLAAARADERQRVLAEAERKNKIAAFAQTVTVGKRALPSTADEISALLDELPDAAREKVQALLGKVAEVGTVDLSEIGDSQGTQTKTLSGEIASALRSHLASGGKIETFFAANHLGEPQAYDLAAFGK